MKEKVLDIVQLLIGIALVLTPKFIAPVCPYDHGSGNPPMKCFHMGNAVFTLGSALVFILIVNILIKNDAVKLGLQVGIGILSLCAIYISKWGIGGCMHHDMSCQARTIPTVLLLGGIMVVLAGVSIFRGFTKLKNER